MNSACLSRRSGPCPLIFRLQRNKMLLLPNCKNQYYQRLWRSPVTARGNRLFGHNTICIRQRRECETGSSQHKSPHKARAFRRGLYVVTSSVKAIRMSARTVFTNDIHGNFYIYTGIQQIESFFVLVVTCLNSVSPLGASEVLIFKGDISPLI